MVELVKRALEPSTNGTGYVGDVYRMDGARLEFTVDEPIPVYLAGRGPRVLEAAGEVADGVLIGGPVLARRDSHTRSTASAPARRHGTATSASSTSAAGSPST